MTSDASASLPLSVVMPAFNEEGAIADAVDEVRRVILDRVDGAELIVVDDGSTDGTGPILDALAADGRIRVIHRANGGHGAALRTGLDAARGAYLFLLDSDRQIPLDDFPALWVAALRTDGVFGVRRRRDDPWTRLWLTRVIRLVVRLLFGVSMPDANVPFKLFRRSLWDDARPFIPEGTLAPSLFLALFVARGGYRVDSSVVPHRARGSGVPSIRHWKLLRFALRGFGQLLLFRIRIRHA